MGTVKDRPARAMVRNAIDQGVLKPGMTLIEASAGSTGFSLASLARANGLRFIVVSPDSISSERRAFFQILGAQVVLTPAVDRIIGSYAKALELVECIPNSLMLDQFRNDWNWLSHYHGTGPEVWEDTHGQVDIVVVGIGTGGTFTGIARYLKARNSNIQMIAVEPEESPVLAGGHPGSHGIFGIGPGFVSRVMDRTLIDDLILISTADAYTSAALVMAQEGIPLGPSSGATVCAALNLAARPENREKKIVALATDSAERYVTTSFGEKALEFARFFQTQSVSPRFLEKAQASFLESTN